MPTTYTSTITPKAATGNGDIDGFTVACSCGNVTSISLPGMAERYKADHEAWHARKDAQSAMPASTRPRKSNAQAPEAMVLATKIRKGIRLYRRATVLPSGTSWQGSFRTIGLLAESNAYGWFGQVDTAVQGIAYAVNTGRVSGTVARAIRELSDWDVCALIADVALACTVIGQVPQYLARRFATA